MRRALLLLPLTVSVAQAQSSPQNIHVRFGNLYWVGVKTLLPTIMNGQVMVPPSEACDLLGLKCLLNGQKLSVNGQEQPVFYQVMDELFLTPLAPLVKAAGQNIAWDGGAKVATVSGGTGSQGWRSTLAQLPVNQTPYLGPLRTSATAPQKGQPTVQRTIYAAGPLGNLSFFSKTTGSLTITGSLTPGTPDNPNRWLGCQSKTTCTLPAPRDALWTLADLTTP